MGCGCNSALTMRGVDGGECDAPFKAPFPSDVDALKARISAQVQALELGVASCKEFSSADRAAWSIWLTTWQVFAHKETPFFGSYGDWVTACSFGHTVDAWRSKLASACVSVPGPDPVKGVDTSSLKEVSTALVAVAAVVGVLGVVYVVRTFR